MKATTILALVYIFILFSCEQATVIPTSSLFGKWQEIDPPANLVFEGTSITSLNFESDSAYQLVYRKWDDAVRLGDPCMMVSNYFVKGNIRSNADHISFDGCYSDESFRDCIARCDGIMDHAEGYRFILTSDTLKMMPEETSDYTRVLVRSN